MYLLTQIYDKVKKCNYYGIRVSSRYWNTFDVHPNYFSFECVFTILDTDTNKKYKFYCVSELIKFHYRYGVVGFKGCSSDEFYTKNALKTDFELPVISYEAFCLADLLEYKGSIGVSKSFLYSYRCYVSDVDKNGFFIKVNGQGLRSDSILLVYLTEPLNIVDYYLANLNNTDVRGMGIVDTGKRIEAWSKDMRYDWEKTDLDKFKAFITKYKMLKG